MWCYAVLMTHSAMLIWPMKYLAAALYAAISLRGLPSWVTPATCDTHTHTHASPRQEAPVLAHTCHLCTWHVWPRAFQGMFPDSGMPGMPGMILALQHGISEPMAPQPGTRMV